MDRLDAMAAFVAALDEGSLAAAGRRLGYSPASVTRAITALEARLGTPLLLRTTRLLRLTPFGETYLPACRQVLAEVHAAERGAAAAQTALRGRLTVTAPVLFGRLKLRPVLDAFLNANPTLQARLLLLDRVVNLADEGVDVAVRLAHLPDSALLATRLGEVRRVLCAAPAYLDLHGWPRAPGELSAHCCIMASDAAWSFAAQDARRSLHAVTIRPRLTVNSAAAAIDSALAGHGITRVLSYQVAADVAAGRLVLLLEDYEPTPVPVHFVMTADRAAARLRRFIDFAAPLLRAELAQG